MSQDSVNVLLPDGWEAEGVLGQGAFGTVYRARRVNGADVEWAAIRHISVPSGRGELDAICTELGTRDPETVNRYLSESLRERLAGYGVMKSLQGQPNIVTCAEIRQYAKKDGPGFDAYIRTELLESLSSRMIDGKTDRDETIRMGMDICRALGVLRSKGLVHRDIRPQTILVNDSGNCLLGGFGTAAGIQDQSAGMSRKNVTPYTSPEIAQGRSAGQTSDIYSLGLVMYRLMNRNRPPFLLQGEAGSARLLETANTRRLSGEPLPKPADADEELGWIILKACAYAPEERWQTPEEMYRALEALGEETVRLAVPFPPAAIPGKPANPPAPAVPAKPSAAPAKPAAGEANPRTVPDSYYESDTLKPTAVPTASPTEPFVSVVSQPKRSGGGDPKNKIIICLIVLIVLLLGCVIYGLINGSSQRQSGQTPVQTASDAPVTTGNPTGTTTVDTTETPTAKPSESPTEAPTTEPTESPAVTAPATDIPVKPEGGGSAGMTILETYTDPPTRKPSAPAGGQGSGGGEETAVPPMPIWWDVPNEN